MPELGAAVQIEWKGRQRFGTIDRRSRDGKWVWVRIANATGARLTKRAVDAVKPVAAATPG